jgi:hypothetical protein
MRITVKNASRWITMNDLILILTDAGCLRKNLPVKSENIVRFIDELKRRHPGWNDVVLEEIGLSEHLTISDSVIKKLAGETEVAERIKRLTVWQVLVMLDTAGVLVMLVADVLRRIYG